MAKRIPVVLSQSSRVSPAKRQLEEDIVATLLLEDGVEISVIPDLADLDEDDTGLLCLEGITGDMILLCWTDGTDALRLLERNGIAGRLGRTMMDSEEVARLARAAATGRAIYVLDLNLHRSAEPYRREIHRVGDEARTATFQILGTAPMAPAKPKPESARPDKRRDEDGADPTSTEKDAPALNNTKPADDSPGRRDASQPTPSGRIADDDVEGDEMDRELDDLLDAFDRADP